MTNPLMTEMLDGLLPKGGGFFRKMTGAEDNSLATTSFQDVFDTIHQNNQEAIRKSDDQNNDLDYRKFNQNNTEKTERAETPHNEKTERVASVDERRADRPTQKTDAQPETMAPATEALHAPEQPGADEGDAAVNGAVNQILEKLKAMAKEDPEGLKELLADIENLSFEDFLTGLGFTQDQVASLSETLGLSGEMPEQMLTALKSQDSGGLATALFDSAKLADGSKKADPLKEQGLKNETAQNSLEAAANDSDFDESGETERKGDNKSTPREGEAKEHEATNRSNEPKESDASKINLGQEKKKSIVAEAKADKAAAKAEKPFIAPEEINPAVQAAKTQAAAPPVVTAAAKAAGGPAPQMEVGAPATQAKAESAANEAKAEKAATPPPRRDFERMLVNQVIAKARIGLKPGGPSQLTVRLDPPSLGKVDIRMIVEENSVRAVLMAENREVKAAIEQNINSLRHSLNQSGMKVDEISVTTRDDGGLFFNNQQASNQEGQGGHQESRSSLSGSEPQSTAGDDNVHDILTRRAIHQGALDVVA